MNDKKHCLPKIEKLKKISIKKYESSSQSENISIDKKKKTDALNCTLQVFKKIKKKSQQKTDHGQLFFFPPKTKLNNLKKKKKYLLIRS